MKYKIELKKTITAKRYLVQGTVAFPTKRSSLIPILMLAAERKAEDQYLTVSDLHASMLSKLPLPASKNVLNKLTTLGLLDPLHSMGGIGYRYSPEEIEEGFLLTELGQDAADHQEIWENQYSTWEITIVDHPFFAQAIVDVVASKWEKEETRDGEEPKSKLKTPSIHLPKQIMEHADNTLELQSGRQRIEQLEPKCQALPDQTLQLEIKIGEGGVFGRLLRGQAELIHHLMEDLDAYEAVTELLDTASDGNYDSEQDQIFVHFDRNRLEMEREIQIKEPVFAGQKFDSINIPKVTHFPKTKADAVSWYQHLVCKSATDWFTTIEAFEKHERTIAAKFVVEYEILAISLQTAVELSREIDTPFYDRMKFETLNDLVYL